MQDTDSPFHPGEQQVQDRLGVRDIERWARKAMRGFLPEQHRVFHTSLPFLVVAARDANGRPWATLLAGGDGFVSSPDPKSLVIDATPADGDALADALGPGTDIGILGIELATRRRNRINGRIAEGGAMAIVCTVDQTFGNCPRFIQERNWRRVEGEAPGMPLRSTALSQSQQSWIANADTFFIASGYRGSGENASFGMDASHRGGEPGFVEVANDTRLIFPDYAGNNLYNTIGNLTLDPRAGLLFVDFASGSLIQLTGQASIDWEPGDLTRFPEAKRLVTLAIDEVVELPRAVPLRWDANPPAKQRKA